MKSIITVVTEAIIVGLVLILFIYLAQVLLKLFRYPTVATPEECRIWNSTYIMEATAFLAGFLFHIVLEYSGVNKWYVDKYYAA